MVLFGRKERRNPVEDRHLLASMDAINGAKVQYHEVENGRLLYTPFFIMFGFIWKFHFSYLTLIVFLVIKIPFKLQYYHQFLGIVEENLQKRFTE